jgi:hypothetical protein
LLTFRVRYNSSRVRHTSFWSSEVTTCSRFWTYRLGSKSCRLSWMTGKLRGLCTLTTSRICRSRLGPQARYTGLGGCCGYAPADAPPTGYWRR